MKRYWVRLQLRCEAPKDVKLEMLSRRAALSGNYIAIIATFSSFTNITALQLIWSETATLLPLHRKQPRDYGSKQLKRAGLSMT